LLGTGALHLDDGTLKTTIYTTDIGGLRRDHEAYAVFFSA
jgi:hypothetical protein